MLRCENNQPFQLCMGAWHPSLGFHYRIFFGYELLGYNLTAPYMNNAECILYSPTFDFTGTYQADITFWVNYDMERIFDFVLFQYTLDHGDTWQYMNIPGMYSNDGMSGQWTKASLSTTAFAGYNQVVFRFIFSSDGSITGDGYSIDDFNIKALTVGVEDAASLSAFTAFPNPTNGHLNLELPSHKNYSVQVINSFGSVVNEFEVFNSSIYNLDLSGYRQGSYYLRVTSGDAIITKKILLTN